MNLRLYPLLVLSVLIFSCSREFSRVQKKGTTEEKYAAAVKYYKKADYYKASVLFEEIAPLLKGDSTAERTQFYNAYANYYLGNYQMSSYLFNTFYATYNNSPFAEEAYYMYAYSMYKDTPPYNLDQTNTLTAIDALQTFINSYPDSKYADDCAKNLQDLRERLERKSYEKAKQYFKTRDPSWGGLSNYLASVVTIDNFKKDFPDSKYNEELSAMQITAQYELADLSLFNKQKERYNQAIEYYNKFIDKYPNSKYLKDLEKLYDKSLKGLQKVAEIEKQIEEMKKQAEAAKAEEVDK
ncbi:outer membrane protein assembly factor BamD [Leadbetterella byssophila]|jgi:outer membrane protein assembly factor BamD|uniref:Outer membrane assembly lipoprotein YfiO n=1 Tax=Leadbetterella byssophila (strain DSM 17132 / JCM 16389 / KACC 11308 / NBRC 106382 / 4M15) TaxID=649349 RepID=E4RZC1_LEAB4|nr:outer membrane protein assembly factor BamD [Leadbetterella byssophila]ADQ16460.1 outer membrane assembly lipoprotein YfiO [Leadbetterella byssophila DSM 17132]